MCHGYGVWYGAVNTSADKVVSVELQMDGEF
jgi:hypothetical protein